MKKLLVSLFVLATSILQPLVSEAASISAVPKRVVYTGSNVTASSYYNVYPQSLKAIKAMSIMNSGSVGLYLALGATGSEIDQLIIPASMSVPVIIPMAASGFQQISVKSISNMVVPVGELQISFIFN